MIEILLAIALTITVLGVVLLWHVVPAFRRASRRLDRDLWHILPPGPPPPPLWVGSRVSQEQAEDLKRRFLDAQIAYPSIVLGPGERIIPMPSYEDKAETAAWQASTMEPAVDMSGFAMETTGGFWGNGKKSYPWGPPKPEGREDFTTPGVCRDHGGEDMLNRNMRCFDCAELYRVQVENEWLDSYCPHLRGRKPIKRNCEECQRQPRPTLRSPMRPPERR